MTREAGHEAAGGRHGQHVPDAIRAFDTQGKWQSAQAGRDESHPEFYREVMACLPS